MTETTDFYKMTDNTGLTFAICDDAPYWVIDTIEARYDSYLFPKTEKGEKIYVGTVEYDDERKKIIEITED